MFNKKDLWENIQKKNEILWLTRSKTKSVLRYHNITIEKNKEKQKTIMEIGIGFGNTIKKLSKYYNVIAVDISQIALNRVNKIAKTYLTEDLSLIKHNSVDWVLCHLVFQHCDDAMVKYLLKNVLNILKVDGFFSFQFADLPNKNVFFDENYKYALENGIMHFRSLEKMKQIINDCGGKIISISHPIIWPNSYNITWYIIKCNKYNDK